MPHNTYHLAKERLKVLKKELKAHKNKTASPTKAVTTITTALQDINNYLVLYPFSSIQEELAYYKTIKPQYYTLLLYYTEQQKITLQKKQVTQTKKSKKITTPTLHWTASKVALVELLYAIQASGSFNDGKTTLKELITSFENNFQINLGQYSKTYLEIRSRKAIEKTQFLDQLKKDLLEKINQTDNK